MYERMLDRTAEPFFRALNETLSDKRETQRRIRFPYGTMYGFSFIVSVTPKWRRRVGSK